MASITVITIPINILICDTRNILCFYTILQ